MISAKIHIIITFLTLGQLVNSMGMKCLQSYCHISNLNLTKTNQLVFLNEKSVTHITNFNCSHIWKDELYVCSPSDTDNIIYFKMNGVSIVDKKSFLFQLMGFVVVDQYTIWINFNNFNSIELQGNSISIQIENNTGHMRNGKIYHIQKIDKNKPAEVSIKIIEKISVLKFN